MRGILHHLPFREPNQETIAKSSKVSTERSYGAERPHELVKPELYRVRINGIAPDSSCHHSIDSGEIHIRLDQGDRRPRVVMVTIRGGGELLLLTGILSHS